MTDVIRVPRERLDRRLAAVVVASFVVHFGFVAYLRQLDWPRAPEPVVRLVVPRGLPAPALPEKKAEPAVTRAGKPGGGATKRRTFVGSSTAGMVGLPAGILDGLVRPSDSEAVFAGLGTQMGDSGPRLREAIPGARREGQGLILRGPAAVDVGERGGERRAPTVTFALEPHDLIVDAEEVAAVIRRHLQAIRSCYERRLRELEVCGKLVLRLRISAAGNVLEAEALEDTMRDVALANCIESRARGWRFEPSSSGFEVRLPFVFQAAK